MTRHEARRLLEGHLESRGSKLPRSQGAKELLDLAEKLAPEAGSRALFGVSASLGDIRSALVQEWRTERERAYAELEKLEADYTYAEARILLMARERDWTRQEFGEALSTALRDWPAQYRQRALKVVGDFVPNGERADRPAKPVPA